MSLFTSTVLSCKTVNLNIGMPSLLKRMGSFLVVLFAFALVSPLGSLAQNVNVTATGGTLSASYANVSAAFAAINAGTHQGAISLSIVNNTSEPASPTALLRSTTPSNYSSVLISPSGGNWTINSAAVPTANRGIIELNGADNITIDGDDPGTAGSQNLTIQSATSTATGVACVRISSSSTLGTDGANNVTVKNCNIIGSRPTALSTTTNYGINMSNYSTTSMATAAASCLNTRIENNNISRCWIGIFANGTSGFPNTGMQILNNTIGSATDANSVGNRGIVLVHTAASTGSALVSGNDVRVGVSATGYSNTIAGIEVGTGNFGFTITRNNIHDINQPSTGGWGAHGIYVTGSANNTQSEISNNFIRDCKMVVYQVSATSTFIPTGVFFTAGATNVKFTHNTIVMGPQLGAGANFSSYCVDASVTGVTFSQFTNNILVNNHVSTAAYGFHCQATTNISAGTVNNNDYYVPGGNVGNYNAAARTTLAAWQTATGKDANAISANPPFVSATDLHLVNGANTQIESAGASVATTGISSDYDGQARPGTNAGNGFDTAPDIGADEFDGVGYTPGTVNSVSVAGAGSCTATSHLVTANVSAGSIPLTSVVINYSFNGVAQTPVTMSGGTATGTSNWIGTIPAATPVNATVTYSVSSNDGASTITSATGSYKDASLTGFSFSFAQSPAIACAGSPVTLTATLSSGSSPSYTAPPAVGSPTVDEDLGNVTITQGATTILNNTSARNTLVGTIGTASGTAGSFANYTAFGPYTLVSGQSYNFSVSTLQSTTAFSNAIGIWIDYNVDGDFNDAGENVYTSATTTSGAHTETGSFTVPSGVAGLSRMRVLVNEGAVTGPTMSVSWGEYEEYAILLNPLTSYSWSSGGSTNSTTVSPATNTAYTLTGTDANGCTVSGSHTVTVTALPAAPSTFPSSQCGTGVPLAFALGGGPGQYRWYLTATGGTALAGENEGSLSSYTISATTTFYIAVTDGTCESLRVPVVASVSAPDAVTASASSTSVCIGGSLSLTANKAPGTNTYTYTWTASPAAGSGIPTSIVTTNANAGSITPTAAGTYVYSVSAVDGSCLTTSQVTVDVHNLPSVNNVTVSPATAVCAGSSVTLSAQSISSGPGLVTLGAGTSTTSTAGITPFNSNWEGSRVQYIIRASELQATGLLAGNITSLSFNVTSTGSGTFAQSGYTIKIAHTGAADLATGYATPSGAFTTVYGPATEPAPATGARSYTFASPFNWDGTSNIVIDICHDNDINATCASCFSGSSAVSYTATSYSSVFGTYDDNAQSCGVSASLTSSSVNRPNMVFGGVTGVDLTSSMNFVWNPGALSGALLTIPVASTETYVVTVTNPLNNCSNTGSVLVNVNPLPATPSGGISEQCGTKAPDAAVSSNSGAASPIFKWYDAQVGGNLLQTGSSTTYTTPISVSTTFWVSELDATTGCESDRVQVDAFVNSPDPITASASALIIGVNNPLTLSYTQTGTINTYSYSWSASPEAGSGLTNPTPATGDITITPTTPGTYIYTVTGNEGDCNATSSVTVVVRPLPVVTHATATPAVSCAGAPVVLKAQSTDASTANANIGAGSTTISSNYNAVFYSLWSNKHMQIMVRASELTAAGLMAGNLNKISFPVTVADTDVPQGFTIKMAHTANTTMAAFVTTGLTQVYFAATQPFSVGNNTITLNTPFAWDGTSNLVIDVCFGGINSNTMSCSSPADATSYVSVIKTHTSATTASAAACANNTSQVLTYSVRPRIILEGQVGTYNFTNLYTYKWNPGNIIGSTVTVNPTATTTYSVTATDADGIVSLPVNVNVTVNPLPGAPATVNSTQCGFGVPTASVSGTGNGTGTFKWYDAATGGTLLQNSTSATYTSAISSTTTFYVSEMNTTTGCEGPRSAVTVTVTPTDAITASSIPASGCLGNPISLSVTQSGSTQTYTYSWTATGANAASSGMTGSMSGASVSVIPTATGTYTYQVVGTDVSLGCAAVTTVSVTVNPKPQINSVTATPATTCPGAPVTLSAVAAPIVSATVGTGTTTTSTSGATPYTALWEGARVQYLVRASELTAAGLTAGPISSLSFNVTSTTNTFVQNGFTIKMAHTANTAITGAFGTPTGAFTTCYGPINTTVSTTGVKQYLFSNSFNWDGVSNILVDVCHDNDINGTCPSCFGSNSTVAYTATSYNSVYGIYADNLPNCGQTSSSNTLGSGSYTNRPNMVFGAGAINWIWSPGGLSGSSVTVNPAVSTSYTATAVNPATGCSSTSLPVAVTVVPLACSGITVSPVNCANSNFNLTANVTGATGLTYTWSDGFGTGYPNAASITANLPAGTYTFTVVVTSPCGETCTQTASVTVNALPVVTVSATTTTLCGPGNSATLTASGASTYAWSPATGLSATTGATVTASPLGTTTYNVVGTNANGCVSSSVTQQIVVGPAISLATSATPSMVCPGGTSQLNAVPTFAGAFGGQAKTYAFATSTGAALDPMTGAATATGASNDDTPSSLLNIGFNFYFEGAGYNTFSITPDGFIKLGTVTTSQFSNSLTSTTNVPKLAPFWDDMATGTTGNVRYLVTGTAPNRILKVQWFVTIPRSTTGAANSTFQAWLYEGSNKIEYRYGAMGTTSSASVGLSGALTTATNFESVTTSTHVMSSTTANNTNTAAPGSGRMYSFTPVQALNYSWSPATFLSNTNTANPTASGVTATTNYTVTVTDPVSGCNTSSIVTVQLDNIAPVPPVLATATGECFVQLTAPVAVDNCSGNVTGTTPEMLFIEQGTFTVIWTFTDATGNTSTATQTVIVDDVTPPVVPTLATLTGECTVTVPIATAQDECMKTIAGTTTDPLTYSTQGTHIVNWTFDDGNGNVSTTTQTVVIDDITPPTITCPSNILLSACTATATWATPIATDNCAYGLSVTQIAGPAPGSTFANGSTTTITYRATDAGGNQVTCSFTVTRRAALVASASFTPILCNGTTSQVTVTAVGGDGNYSGTGTFTALAGTHTYTVTDGEGCADDVTVTIGQPSAIVTSCSNSNPEIFFGYSADNTATITASATGGTGPYTISFSMDRAMKCNVTDAAGDETWVGGAGTVSSVNTVCPGAGAGLIPVTTSGLLTAGSTYSVTVKLMANAVITATITDANGCIEKCTTPVFAKDVRCYTGSGIWKVKVCHRTGSGCNSNCVNEDAVANHLAHGDFLGDCTPSCTAPAPGGRGISLPITKAQPQVEDVFELAVSPNPTTTEFNMEVISSNAKDKLLINLYDATGKLYKQFRGTTDQLIRFGRELKAGVYMVEVIQAGRRKTASLVKL